MIHLTKLERIPEDAFNLFRGMGMDRDIITAEVENGTSECWELNGYGHMITRVEIHEPSGIKTLVIVATGLTQRVQSAYRDVFPLIEKIARDNGFAYIRAHCDNEPMARYLRSLGFTYKGSEYGREIQQ